MLNVKYKEYDINNKGKYELIKEMKQALDYSLHYSDERIQYLESILSEHSWLSDYSLTEQFAKKQVKGKTQQISEGDGFSQLLEQVADYLLFTDYKNESHKQQIEANEVSDLKLTYPTLTNNKKSNNLLREKALDDLNETTQQATLYRKSKKKALQDRKVSMKEIKKSIYLQQIHLNINNLEKSKATLANQLARRKVTRLIGDLKYEMFLMNEMIRGSFSFGVSNGRTMYCWTEDTGYLHNDEYIHISENKIDLRKTEHVKGLIYQFAELSTLYEGKVNEMMFEILRDFIQLVNSAKLSTIERTILHNVLQLDLSYAYKSYINEAKFYKINNDNINDMLKTEKKLSSFTINPKYEIIERASAQVSATQGRLYTTRQIKRYIDKISERLAITYKQSIRKHYLSLR
ncbi:hypothetical protein [Paenibacillus sp. UMB4589-SE434]|uniref:hypothetical protein n=1 Tax=Paenibacillus sp. UMB4589-SE434 TaxID=3046314 RepID=UPI00254A9DF4|nr:hypothetical protein [Paenibacillus sp. UMB4589-SE434]MDK8179420.1 hypothetical protein [Paenibacillus sp. UMB4589-SE434]